MSNQFTKVTDKNHGVPSNEIEAILKKAARDPFLGNFIYGKKLTDMILFISEGILVGFAIPRKDSDGHYRTGPIYVEPSARGKGIAGEFVKSYFEKRKGRSWIEKKNVASQKTFESAGFRRTNKVHVDPDGTVLYEYIKSE